MPSPAPALPPLAATALALLVTLALPAAAAPDAAATGAATSATPSAPAVATAPGVDTHALLVAADRWRTGASPGSSINLAVETQVQLMARDGTVDKERRYTVYVQSGRRTLVLMRSPAEAGQKVLMLGDDFWLLLPGSQRPMRITPSQKLLGEASTGDIATLSWAEDYSARLVGDEACEPQDAEPAATTATAAATTTTTPGRPAGPVARTCQHLSLQAARKGLSYQRIELWLGKARHEPVRAEFYVQSDKLAKQASFEVAHGRVDAMVLTDRLANQRQTRVSYLGRQPRVLPESSLNPMALARSATLE
ncbi:MAG: hypothetical protein RLZZ584_3652 [Pseudomonadota bacterium]